MKYKIALFPGDGVGPELINEGVKVIDKAAELDKFEVEWIKYPHGAEHFLETQELLTEKVLKEIKNSCNAIYCGTFDTSLINAHTGKHISSILKDYFDQFISLRPIKLMPTIESPLANKTYNEIDFVVIRENTEDFYVGISGRAKNDKNRNKLEINKSAIKVKIGIDIETKSNEISYQIGVLSKKGCERIIKYAFEFAKIKNIPKILFVDKANILNYYGFWRECVDKIAKDYKNIEYEFGLIDATLMNLIRQPEKHKMIVAPSLFGDILSDLGSVLQGGLLFGAKASINPDSISMFEPIHGSAPKLKGQGIINPIATIWAGALMLDNIGQNKASALILKAIEHVLKEGRTRTQDIDGNNTTSEMGDSIMDKLIEIHD